MVSSETPDSPSATANAIWTLDNRRMSLVKAIIDTLNPQRDTSDIDLHFPIWIRNWQTGRWWVGQCIAKDVEITILYHATDMAIGRPPRGHEAEGFLWLMSVQVYPEKGHPDHAKHVIADDTSVAFTANLDGNHGPLIGGVRLSRRQANNLVNGMILCLTLH